MKESEAAKLVSILMAAFPAGKGNDQTAMVYEAELVDLDAELASRAIRRMLRTSKFLPSIAEIRGAAVAEQRGPLTSGLEAWGALGEAIARIGHYQVPTFRDERLAECVRLMGWRYLCKSPNEMADRARFVELYEHLQDRERTEKQIGRLTSGTDARIAREQGEAAPVDLIRKLTAGIGRPVGGQ